VKPFATYTSAIAEGYDSGLPAFRAPRGEPEARDRRPRPRALHGAGPLALRDRIKRVVDTGAFPDGSPVAPDPLGAAVEPSVRRGGPTGFGNFHGFGHVLIALAEDPRDTSRPGVMWTTATAIMDPSSTAGNRHIDDQLARWQDTQRRTTSPTRRPRPRSSRWLVFTDTVPQASRTGAALQTWAKRTFGGTKWANAFDGSPLVAPGFETGTRTRSTPAGPLEYLDHRDFLYVLRLENARAQRPT
jgi:hypothetical protein